MSDKQFCGAHDIMMDNTSHLRDSVGEIYGLVRDASKERADMKSDINGLKIKVDSLNEKMDTGFKRNAEVQAEILKKLNSFQPPKKRNWKPILSLVSVLVGGGGIAAYLVLFVK